jgi:tRNA(Ile)-lysidine synthase
VYKDNMLTNILRFIKENGLFSEGDTVVVAVSGGADSVALLDILSSLPELKLNLVTAHLNHLLRGAESDGDEKFVRKLAGSYGVPILVKRVDVGESARRDRRSLEDAGRVARYAFFDEVAVLNRAHAVALAHHADDQAETVLMRLLRGAGGSGLCAMAPRSAGRYVRPLLGATRGEIEAYLQRRGLPFRTDSSNGAMDFLRNRIRHELIPSLSSYNPAITERLGGTARALAADEEFLEAATDAAFARHVTLSAGRVLMALPGVRSEPRGIRWRLYRRAIFQAKGDLLRIGFRHLQDIDRLIFSPKPHLTLVLPDLLQIARSYEEVSFAPAEERMSPLHAEFFVDRPGIYPLPGGGSLAVDHAIPPDDLKSVPATTAWFDLAKAPFPWLVRSFRPGDRFSPFGMAGQKKVKDLFIDAKLPVASRSRIPLLFCGETLLWVGGVRVSNAARLTERTETAVRAEISGFAPYSRP